MSDVFEYNPTWSSHPIIINGTIYDYDPSLLVPVPEGHEDYGKTVQQIVGSDKITDAMIAENKELETWAQMRKHRNRLLVESDWTQGEDVPSDIKTPWAEYRKKLRDITEASSTSEVLWPTKPSAG